MVLAMIKLAQPSAMPTPKVAISSTIMAITIPIAAALM